MSDEASSKIDILDALADPKGVELLREWIEDLDAPAPPYRWWWPSREWHMWDRKRYAAYRRLAGIGPALARRVILDFVDTSEIPECAEAAPRVSDTMTPEAAEQIRVRADQMHRAHAACAGLDLPADVKEGAVKRLVGEVQSFLAIGHELSNEGDDLRAALRELTGESK